MECGLSLIDKASKVCGSDSELARRMGVHRVAIAEMRSGKRKISPETAAELADLAGDDAREAAIQTMIENAKGTRREGALREILGKALAAGVAGLLVFSYSPGPAEAKDSASFDVIRVNPLYILEYFKRLKRSVQSLLAMAAIAAAASAKSITTHTGLSRNGFDGGRTKRRRLDLVRTMTPT